jgi:hypothetical protein
LIPRNADNRSQLWTFIDDRGDLPAPTRLQVLRGLLLHEGDLSGLETALGMQCAERVWGYWTDVFPGDDSPIRLLRYLQTYLDRSSTVRSQVSQLRGRLDVLLSLDHPPMRAVAAGFAVWAACRDLAFGRDADAPLVSEYEADPLDWSPCFYASIAVAGGASWEANSDASARRGFWMWFLAEAADLAEARHGALERETDAD